MVFNLGAQRRPKHGAKREWLMSWTCGVFVFCPCDSEVRLGGWTWFSPQCRSSCRANLRRISPAAPAYVPPGCHRGRWPNLSFPSNDLPPTRVSARPRPKCSHQSCFYIVQRSLLADPWRKHSYGGVYDVPTYCALEFSEMFLSFSSCNIPTGKWTKPGAASVVIDEVGMHLKTLLTENDTLYIPMAINNISNLVSLTSEPGLSLTPFLLKMSLCCHMLMVEP